MSLLNEITTGARVLTDWLGNGGTPVCQDTANSRALSCLHGDGGNECPYLTAPNWLSENVTSPIAHAIKEHLEAKGSLKLETALDRAPKMCQKCGCHMPTKAWVPIEHIAAHTSPETLSKMPAWCWVRQEVENL